MAIVEAKRENDRDRTIDAVADEHGHQRVADLERTSTKPTETVLVPGIGTGVAYAADDALGTQLTMQVPDIGIIMGVQSIDTDDEEIDFNILVFDAPFTPVADNAPFTLDASDYQHLVGVITMDTFVSISGDTLGAENNVNLPYTAPNNHLYLQVVTTSNPTYATGTGIRLKLMIWTRLTWDSGELD